MLTKHECPSCKGWGYTRKSATEYHFVPREDGTAQYVTDLLGSGCLLCKGVGYVEVDAAN